MAAHQETKILNSNLKRGRRFMKIGIVIVVILVVLALILGSSYVGRRNQMAVKREAVNAAWAQVDVVLQRRADLIPNLVATVKGFAVHEEQVFSEIAQARSALIGARTPADKIAANGALDSALSRLLVITENYPQLKSNENFLRLQDELAGTENRIAVERRRYNEVVQDYNTYISLFPNSLVASIGGFTRNDAYFKTEEGARTAPKVNFDFNKSAAPATPAPAPAKP
jgi:LemA protein